MNVKTIWQGSILILFSFFVSNVSSAAPGRFCGVYHRQMSCGTKPGIVGILMVENLGSIRLRSACYFDQWYACRLRMSLLMMMQEGQVYCVEGELSKGGECSDHALDFDFVAEPKAN